MARPQDPAAPVAQTRTAELDSAAVSACQAGQVSAFEQIFISHGPKMKSIALNLLGSTHDAEDAVQESFLKIYRSIGNFRGQSALSTWVYRIVVNTCYDMRRRGLRHLAESIEPESPDDAPIEFAAPRADHPLRISLERCVARLSEANRSVFVLFEVEGFAHSEIAGMLGISEGASKNRLFEAKRHLRQMLAHLEKR